MPRPRFREGVSTFIETLSDPSSRNTHGQAWILLSSPPVMRTLFWTYHSFSYIAYRLLRNTHIIVPKEGSNNPRMSICPYFVKIPWSIRNGQVSIGEQCNVSSGDEPQLDLLDEPVQHTYSFDPTKTPKLNSALRLLTHVIR